MTLASAQIMVDRTKRNPAIRLCYREVTKRGRLSVKTKTIGIVDPWNPTYLLDAVLDFAGKTDSLPRLYALLAAPKFMKIPGAKRGRPKRPRA